MSVSLLDLRRLAHGTDTLHRAGVIVESVDPDLNIACCHDRRGKRYTIDRRSAVSLSALHVGMALKVEATRGGVVKFLVFDDD